MQLFTEARTLHRDGYLLLCEEDRILLETTDIGEYAEYEGEKVPLDLPFEEEEEIPTNLPRAGEYGGNIKRNMTVIDKNNNKLRVIDITDNKVVLKPASYSGETVVFPDNYDQFAKIFQFWDYFNLEKIVEVGTKYLFEGVNTKEISQREKSKIQAYDIISETYDISNSYSDIKITSNGNVVNFTFIDKHGVVRRLAYVKGGSVVLLWKDPQTGEESLGDPPRNYADEKVINTFGKILTKVILPKYKTFTFIASDEHRYRLFRAIIANNIDKDIYRVLLDDSKKEIEVGTEDTIQEAEYQGKDVELGKPKRGGSKKFYVYTKNKKGNVIKVAFGAKEGGQNLAVKLDDPKRRKAFSDRHNCPAKTDKTTPGYWSCRLNRYAKQLGMKKNYSGYW